MQFNEAHYKKVLETKVFTNKMHNKLQDDNIRDKILWGRISKDDCDNSKVFGFMQLLKRPNFSHYDPFELITNVEWTRVVK